MSPVSGKVTSGTLGGLITAVIAGALEYYVPVFRSGIPAPVHLLIEAVVGAAGYYGGGWLAHHHATAAEIGTAVAEADAIRTAVAGHPAGTGNVTLTRPPGAGT